MGESIKDKLDRLSFLLEGDEDLQFLNTELRAKMAAHEQRHTPQGEGPETHDLGFYTLTSVGANEWTVLGEDAITALLKNDIQWPAQEIPKPTINIASSYCPALALARLPLAHKPFEEEAKTAALAKFFESANIWGRTWTFHYLALPPGCYKRLLLLVPLKEAYDFVHEVNTALTCDLVLQNDENHNFILQFDDAYGPRPEFLGVSSSLATKDKLVIDKSFAITGSWGDWSRSYEPNVLKALEEKIGEGLDAERHFRIKDKKSKKGKKRLNALERARAWAESMNRLQQYFGLRPNFAGIAMSIPPVNVGKPVPWSYPEGPIFFGVDLEWKETNASQVTEIGISILDTLDLVDPPGLHGANWVQKIRSYHLRVSEHRLFVNNKYCQGCPNDFNFGASEFVDSANVGERVDQFFVPPYNGNQPDSLGSSKNSRMRPLIYVGHNTKQDLEKLASLSSETFRKILFNGTESVFEEVLDTAPLYQGLRNHANASSLSNMMTGMNIWTRDLHNGGNDARYVMVALINMALEAAGEHEAAVAEESQVAGL